MRRRAMGLVMLALLGGCATTDFPPPRDPGQERPTSRPGVAARAEAEQVTLMALAMIGTPYRFGGSSLGGFDCSGLSTWVFQQSAGVQLPRNAARQAEIAGKALKRQQLRTGDLVFFETVRGLISHVGIYVGAGRFVHAPSAGSSVRLESMDHVYWAPRFRFGKRVIGSALYP